MIRETKVPSIPEVRDDNVREVLQAVKSVLQVREGNIGDPLDQGATLRDLVALNLAETAPGEQGVTSGSGYLPINPVLPPVIGGYNPETDYTVPPPPTGLRVDGGFTNVFLSWDGAPYRNHAYTEVWRSQTDDLATAVMVGTTAANVYADPASANTTYYYWIRFVSRANVIGPYNQTSGTVGQTAIDVAAVFPSLEEDIANSPLFTELGARIAATETGISEIRETTATSASQLLTLSSQVAGNTASLQIQSRVTDGLGGQYSVKIDNNGHVSGFGLASTTVNGTPRSAFIVRADRFAIAGPNDTTDPLGTLAPTNVPFVVLTTPTVIGGVTYPAGVWIKTAFIADATISSAKIQNLVADKITTGSLTAAVGVTTGRISGGVNTAFQFATPNFGTGFYLGNDGGVYKLYVGSPDQNMNWNGSALTVTGNINAISGSFRNITVYDNLDRVILSSGGINTSILNLPAQQVTGLGTLATQDSVFLGSTVKFPDGSVLGTGDFVNRLSRITPGNVSTFIADAAIGNAYIGNLSAEKITSGFIAADRIDASVINAKVTNIDAAVIKTGTIENARIGVANIDTLNVAGDAITAPTSFSGVMSDSNQYFYKVLRYQTIGEFPLTGQAPPTYYEESSTNTIYEWDDLTQTYLISSFYPFVDLVSTSFTVTNDEQVRKLSILTLANVYPTPGFPGTSVDFVLQIYLQNDAGYAGTLAEGALTVAEYAIFVGTSAYFEAWPGNWTVKVRACLAILNNPTRNGLTVAANGFLIGSKR